MNKSRRMLLITQLSLALGATACLARHPLLGCGVALDPAYCKRVQTPVSIGSAVDPKDSVKDSAVPEGLRGHGQTRLGGAPTWRDRPAKGPPFRVGVGDTIGLRVNGWIKYIDEVRWQSSDPSVATVEWWFRFDQALVVGKKAGIAIISVNVSGQRDSVTLTVSDSAVPR